MKQLLLIIVMTSLIAQDMLAANVPAPTVQVKATIDAVIEILKNKDLDADQRMEALRNAVIKRFDFKSMSQRVMARHWKDALPEQQDQFQKLFEQLLQATYIGRIETYTNERVVYDKERIRQQKAIVDTHIVTSSVDIPISYKLQLKGGEWLIYDVVVEEVSLIRNFRSSYGSIVSKQGYPSLLAKMAAKIEDMKNSDTVKQEK